MCLCSFSFIRCLISGNFLLVEAVLECDNQFYKKVRSWTFRKFFVFIYNTAKWRVMFDKSFPYWVACKKILVSWFRTEKEIFLTYYKTKLNWEKCFRLKKQNTKKHLWLEPCSNNVLNPHWKNICNVYLKNQPIIMRPLLALVSATLIWCASEMKPRLFAHQPRVGLFSIRYRGKDRTVLKMT